MRATTRFLVALGSIGWLSVGALEVAAAELLVIASSAPQVVVGSMVDGSRKLSLADGTSITLLSQSGQTTTLSGPYEGLPASGAEGGDPGLLAKLARLVTTPAQDDSAIGAARAGIDEPPEDPWVVDVSRTGRHCVLADRRPSLWRASADKATSLSLKLQSPRQKVTVKWPRSETTVAWPEKLPLSDGAVYMARLKGSKTAKRLQLHVVPGSLSSDAHRAAWMADAGCNAQAKRLLSGLR